MTFLIESWFWRGTQSAIFYYLSCAPCSKVTDQRRKRREAKRAKIAREKEEAATAANITSVANGGLVMGEKRQSADGSLAGAVNHTDELSPEIASSSSLFRHPLPSGTNPGWEEEIMLGPGPPRKWMTKQEWRKKEEREKEKKKRLADLLRANRKDGDPQQTLAAVGTNSTATTAADKTSFDGKLRPSQSRGTFSNATSRSSKDNHPGPEEDAWRYLPHQREDEELWGVERFSSDASPNGRGTPGSIPRSINRTSAENRPYYYARNPEVNDLHPPVVSTRPASSNEIRWMLQPPPRAKVMEGKERTAALEDPGRTRSESGSTAGSGVSSVSMSRVNSKRSGTNQSLGRQVGEKLLEEKMAKGLGAEDVTRLRTSRSDDNNLLMRSSSTSNVPKVHANGDPFLSSPTKDMRRSKHQPAHASRPPLSPILSSSSTNNLPNDTSPSVRRRASHLQRTTPHHPSQLRRPVLMTEDSASSLYTLQKFLSTSEHPTRSISTVLEVATAVGLPPPTPREEVSLRSSGGEKAKPSTTPVDNNASQPWLYYYYPFAPYALIHDQFYSHDPPEGTDGADEDGEEEDQDERFKRWDWSNSNPLEDEGEGGKENARPLNTHTHTHTQMNLGAESDEEQEGDGKEREMGFRAHRHRWSMYV